MALRMMGHLNSSIGNSSLGGKLNSQVSIQKNGTNYFQLLARFNDND